MTMLKNFFKKKINPKTISLSEGDYFIGRIVTETKATISYKNLEIKAISKTMEIKGIVEKFTNTAIKLNGEWYAYRYVSEVVAGCVVMDEIIPKEIYDTRK